MILKIIMIITTATVLVYVLYSEILYMIAKRKNKMEANKNDRNTN